MMKNCIKKLLVLLLPLLAGACSDEKFFEYISTEPHALGITNDSGILVSGSVNYEFGAKAMTQTLAIHSQGTPWRIENPASWVKLSSTSGSADAVVTISVEENTSVRENRVAVLTLCSSVSEYPIRRTINITQKSATPFVTPELTSCTFDARKQESVISVASNADWSAACSADWVTATRSGKQLIVSVKENTGKTRSANIALMAEGKQWATVSVSQAEAGVTATLDKLSFIPDGEQKEISIDSETSWTASASASWLEVTPASGTAGGHALKISAAANYSASARSAFVYVSIGSTRKLSIPVTQDGVTISPSTTSLNFNADAGKKSLQVTANAGWVAKSSADWLTLSVNKGSKGTTSIEVNATDNQSTAARSATITFYMGDGATKMATVSVKQDEHTLSLDKLSLTFPCMQSMQTLTITTDATWTATVNSDASSWLHITPKTGTGNGKLEVTADTNNSTSERQGTITVNVGDKIQNIAVTQQGTRFSVHIAGALKSTASQTSVVLTSNNNWTAESETSWLTVTPTSGTGSATLTIKATDNASVNSRTGNVIFTAGNESRELIFTQPGKYLDLSTTKVSFATKGGTVDVTVDTDGTAKATTQTSWLTVNLENGVLSITVPENTAHVARSGEITISLTGLIDANPLSKTIVVTQTADAASLTVALDGGSNGVCPNSKPQSFTATITSNTNWTTSSSNTWWLTVSPSYGYGNGKITINAADNPTANSRSATITLKYYGGTKTLTIRQPGRSLSLSESSITLGASGEVTKTVTVASDGEYTAWTNDTWIHVVQSGNRVTISANGYTGEVPRTGTVTVSLSGLMNGSRLEKNITVTQTPKTIDVSRDEYESDEDWNSSDRGDGNIERTDFGTDEDWNRENDEDGNSPDRGNGDIERTDFGTDEDWNN